MALPSLRSGNPLYAFRSMLDDFFNEPLMPEKLLSTKSWPRVDITEEKERFIIRADLPGLKKEDINLSLEGDTLTISGERKDVIKKEEGGCCYSERVYGAFSRSFTLPDNVSKEKIDAQYKDGVLELSLVKVGEAKKKALQIDIK
jgi:HSP20 family protein